MSADRERILELLDDPDGEVRAAATLVLGRLRPVEPRFLELLRARLADASPAEHCYLVDALAATEDASILPDIMPFAEVPGSAAEQVVRILRRFGDAALDAVEARHEGEAGWRSGAYVKAVSGIHGVRAVEMLVRRLDAATWDQARATSICIIENFDAYPAEAQRLLAESVRRRLTDPEADRDTFAVTTCLRLAQHLPLDVALDDVLELISFDRIDPIRRHAIQSLGGSVLDDDELARARGVLHACLFDGSFESVVKPALEVLNDWIDRPAPVEDLEPLLESPHPFAVRYALDGLRAHHQAGRAEDLAPELFESRLRANFPQVRRAAMLGRGVLPGGPERLLEILLAEEDRYLARELGEALAETIGDPDAPAAEELRHLVMESDDDRNRDALIGALVHLDRDHFNARLAAWARNQLADFRPTEVIQRLQPVVRLRHADEEVRYLLARANLATAQKHHRDDGHYRRCIDILSPLARTWGYSVADRIARDETFPAAERLAVAEGLAAKGPVERTCARTVLEGLADHLDEDGRRRHQELTTRLGELDAEDA